MSQSNWSPTTFEDKLLYKYHQDHPGYLFLEVRVGGSDNTLNARRIDGVLIESADSIVYSPGEYTDSQIDQMIRGNRIHLIEAKRTLNRNVIGQVLVGSALLTRSYQPASIKHVALCSSGETDLEWYCRENDVEAALYPLVSDSIDKTAMNQNELNEARNDIRKDPNDYRRRAFLSGWAAAVNGTLYESVEKRKTHTNMGNLFGWVYGDQDYDFRIDTWDRYVDNISDPESLG